MSENFALALTSTGSESVARTKETDVGNPVKERQPSSGHELEPTVEESQEIAQLIEKIDEVTCEIQRQLAEDIAHAESSQLELDRILKEIRLKQESIDKTLGLTG